MKYIPSSRAFTLVELLVTITVLSIIITIGTLAVIQNFATSNDAARLSSYDLIVKNMDIYFLDTSEYPEPDDAVDVTFSGTVLWKQWVFGESVGRKIKNFGSDIPMDPSYDTYFSYSITQNAQEYELAGILESGEEGEDIGERVSILNQSYAAVPRAYVIGTYNKLVVRGKSDTGENYFIATPSIIASDLSSTGAVDIISGRNLVYHDFFNLPATYAGKIDTYGGFDFNVVNPLVFSGSTEYLMSLDGLHTFVNNLKYVYATTPTESFNFYAGILNEDWYSKIKSFLQSHFWIPFKNALSCQDLYNSWEASTDGYYSIDPDGNGPEISQQVYCSIEGWIAYSRIIDVKNSNINTNTSHLGVNGWDFAGMNHISELNYTLYSRLNYNSLVSIPSPVYPSWGPAIHQTGDFTSNYEIRFSDISNVQVGDEIRMMLWVRGNEDGGWTNQLNFNPEAGYMFYNRMYYTDGTFSSNGEAILRETQNIGWIEWKLYEVRHIVRKNPQEFSWFIWLDSEDTRDLYFTGVKLELYRKN